ncbi:MAG TPA: DUF4404 family protein [Chromatiales bacterium]|nr:DUF4404 family protein [Chromatiales bacterium]
MKTKEISQTLEQLRRQIAALDTGDVVTRQRLESLILELEKKLASPEDAQVHKDLATRLDEAVLQFEVSHPRLAAIVNDLIIKLESMGV